MIAHYEHRVHAGSSDSVPFSIKIEVKTPRPTSKMETRFNMPKDQLGSMAPVDQDADSLVHEVGVFGLRRLEPNPFVSSRDPHDALLDGHKRTAVFHHVGDENNYFAGRQNIREGKLRALRKKNHTKIGVLYSTTGVDSKPETKRGIKEVRKKHLHSIALQHTQMALRIV